MECHLFGGGHSTRTGNPALKLTYKRHILWRSTSPRNDFYHPKLCHFSNTLATSTLPKIPLPGADFWGLLNPYTEIPKFLTGVSSGTPIHVCCFKQGRSLCRISVRKAVLYWWQKKTENILAPFGGPPGAISRKKIYVNAHCCPIVIFQVASKSVQFWGSYNRKILPRPLKVGVTCCGEAVSASDRVW